MHSLGEISARTAEYFLLHRDAITRQLYPYLVVMQYMFSDRTELGKYDWSALQHDVASGCLLEVMGRGVIILSGHVARDFDCAKHSDRHVIKVCLLGGASRNGQPQQVLLQGRSFRAMSFCHDHLGVDEAFVPLPAKHVALLRSKKFAFISSDDCANVSFPCDIAVCLGVPVELQSPHSATRAGTTTTVWTSMHVPMIPLAVVPVPRPVCGPAITFAGKVLARTGEEGRNVMTLEDLRGISGGPIFAIRFEERGWRYRFAGIVVGREPLSDVIVGCSIDGLSKSLIKNIKQLDTVTPHR